MAMIEFKDLPDTSTPLNASNLNNNFNELTTKMSGLIKYTDISGLDISAGGTYQLTLPTNTLFIEPLTASSGSSASGGQFLIPGGSYTYLTNNDYTGTYRGIWVTCSSTGLVTISNYNNNGTHIKGFRIWYIDI